MKCNSFFMIYCNCLQLHVKKFKFNNIQLYNKKKRINHSLTFLINFRRLFGFWECRKLFITEFINSFWALSRDFRNKLLIKAHDIHDIHEITQWLENTFYLINNWSIKCIIIIINTMLFLVSVSYTIFWKILSSSITDHFIILFFLKILLRNI